MRLQPASAVALPSPTQSVSCRDFFASKFPPLCVLKGFYVSEKSSFSSCIFWVSPAPPNLKQVIRPIVAAWWLPECHHGGAGCRSWAPGARASIAFCLQCCRGCGRATCAPARRDSNQESAVRGWEGGWLQHEEETRPPSRGEEAFQRPCASSLSQEWGPAILSCVSLSSSPCLKSCNYLKPSCFRWVPSGRQCW